MTLSSLKCQLKNIDEYEYVGKTIKALYATTPDRTKALVNTLHMVQQSYLKGILQSKRVTVQRKGERTTVPRRILKARKMAKGETTAKEEKSYPDAM